MFYTNLHYGNNLFDRIPAIILQPFVNNRYQTVYIKRYHIFLFFRRYTKTLQNRGKYMVFQAVICIVHTEAIAGMLIDKFTDKDGHNPDKAVEYLLVILKNSLPSVLKSAAAE